MMTPPPRLRRSAMVTRAPSWAKASAVARPMPRAPPVTITTLPSNVPMVVPLDPFGIAPPVAGDCGDCSSVEETRPPGPAARWAGPRARYGYAQKIRMFHVRADGELGGWRKHPEVWRVPARLLADRLEVR